MSRPDPKLRITKGGKVEIINAKPIESPGKKPIPKFIQDNKIKSDDLWTTMTGTEMYQWDDAEPGDRVKDIGFARGEYVCLHGKWHSMIDQPKTGGIAYLPVTSELVLRVLARHTGKAQTTGVSVADALAAADRQYKREMGRDDKDDDEDRDTGIYGGYYGHGHYDRATRTEHGTGQYRNYTWVPPAEKQEPPHPTPMMRKPRSAWTKKDRLTAADYPAKHKLLDEACD